jgi:purine nucleosidase
MLNRKKHVVFHDCDGNSDDLVTSILLRLSPEVELVGTAISNGLCYVRESHAAMRSIERYLGVPEVDIGIWEGEMPNPFPDAWRSDSRRYNELPFLAQKRSTLGKPGKAVSLLKRCLRQATHPITVIGTGPLTVVAEVLRTNPKLAGKIRQLIIMGGAVRVPGNVKGVPGADGSAEWNVFCDPYAFKTVLAYDIPIRLISLDVTNKLAITQSLVQKLSEQAKTSRASNVAASVWNIQDGREIYLWDPTTAISVIRPDLFRFEYVDIDVVTDGASLGRLLEVAPGCGRTVELATGVDSEAVLSCFLGLLGSL